MIFVELFYTFFIIGLFGFGGGYGMLSLIQGEVVHHWHWMTTSEFTDIVAISQMTPGPIGINSATYCGYTAVHNAGYGYAASIFGSSLATFALVLPSLVLMILISKMFLKYMQTRPVQSVFIGLRPAVVGLLGAATLLLMTPENFSTPSVNPWQFWISVALFIATFVGTKFFKINPIRMIVYAAIAGLLLFYPTSADAKRPKRPTHDFMTDTLMVHDPVMAYENGVYHCYSTGVGIQHATSKDLKTWTVKYKPAMAEIPKWTHDSVKGFEDHVWAPDIIRYKDRWWMAYSCSTFGKNGSVIGLRSASSLDDDAVWTDEGSLVCSRIGRDAWNAIDPNFVVDENGNPWLAWGSFWDGIQLARLDPNTMHILQPSNQQTIARRYVGKWSPGNMDNPIEAPFIFRHDGYFYLFVSWDYCCKGMKSTYKVVVGRSKNVAGPYLDSEGKDMRQGGGTLVIEGDKKEFEAAGHCSVYHFNDTDYFFCHGYSVALDGMSILIAKKINWSDDGWPQLR